MRFFKDFNEAVSEVKRDLSEMGIEVHPQTMQDIFVSGNPDYETKEVQDYIYKVLYPVPSIPQLHPTQPWADKEFSERVKAYGVNPGTAYRDRPEVWDQFLHHGKFAYTYSERLFFQLPQLIEELIRHPDSRQLYLSIWDPHKDIWQLGGISRVPCSLGYLFRKRREQLDMTYFMRSCDFITHFQNDVYLAVKLLEYVAKQAKVIPGEFTHYIGSLHIYKKDTQGVF